MNWFENWFDENYLEVYQHRNTQEAQAQTELILKHIPLTHHEKILDLGCGYGRYTTLFQEKKLNIEGIDLSAKLIEYGKKSNPQLNLFIADASQYKKENHYSLILSLFTSWGYYEEDKKNLAILEKVKSNLKEKGSFWLDFLNSNLIKKKLKNSPLKKEFISAQGKKIKEINYLKDNRVIKEIEILTKGIKKKYLESVRIYSPEEIKYFFSQLNLTVQKIFGDYHGNPFIEKKSPRFICWGKK